MKIAVGSKEDAKRMREEIGRALARINGRLEEEYQQRVRVMPFRPKFATIVMRYGCVYSCDHCFFFGSPVSKKVLPDEYADKIIDFGKKIGLEAIALSGGEPMIAPENIFRAMRRISEKGMIPLLSSSFLGNTEDEVERNAKTLGESGVKSFLTSLSLYHARTMPQSVKMDYLDYMAMMTDAVTKHGINVDIKNIWDPSIGDESTHQSNAFAKKLKGRGGVFLGEFFGEGEKVFDLNGEQISWWDPSIISVGRARVKGLVSRKEYKWDERLYHCPIFYNEEHMGGELTFYPDGNVARCCTTEIGANFGFGNFYTRPLDEILDRLRGSMYMNPAMKTLLEEGHRMLREEFPRLLPKNGAFQACEICSPIVSRKKTRRRLCERMGIELFNGA